MMRIAILSADPQDHACARLRLLDPIRTIGAAVEMTWNAQIDQERGGQLSVDLNGLDTADLIVIQRTFPRHAAVATLLDAVFALGIPVVYEVDDLLTDIPPDNPMHEYSTRDADLLPAVMRRCSAITVSTEALGAVYRTHNENVHVLPNFLDTGIWTKKRPPASKHSSRIRIGYAGSRTHVADLKVAEDALIRIHSDYGDRIQLVFFGCETPRLGALPGVQRIAGGLGYERYADTLHELALDIAIAPLADNLFNRCKSDVKWLEYALVGAAGIFSDIEAYNRSVDDGRTGLLAGYDTEAWYDALHRLIDDEALRKRIAQSAQQHVLASRTLAQAAPRYRETFECIVRDTAQKHQAAARPTRADIANRLRYAQWLDRHLTVAVELTAFDARHGRSTALPTIRCIVLDGDDADDAELGQRSCRSAASVYGGTCRASHVSLRPRDGTPGHGPSIIARLYDIVASSEEQWVILLRAGDRLAPALAWYLERLLARQPDAWAVYADEDTISDDGAHDNPLLKPDFNLHLLRNANYLGRACLLRRDQLLAVHGFAETAPALATTDALLRILDRTRDAAGIGHLPRILVHCRHVAADPAAVRNSDAAYAALVSAHLARRHIAAEVLPRRPARLDWAGASTTYQQPPDQQPPLVSVLIPTRDGGAMLQRCLETLVDRSGHPALEIIVIDNGSTGGDTQAYLAGLRALQADNLRVLDAAGPFNFSRLINLGAAAARGEFILLLNDDTASLDEGWVPKILAHFQEEDVGAVAPRLILPNGKVQHAGVVLGLGGAADFAYLGASLEDPGYAERLACDQEVSAASAACLMVRAALFRGLGGLDDATLELAYGDFDFCLRLREQGAKLIWTPSVNLLHEGGHTLKAQGAIPECAQAFATSFERNKDVFIARWLDRLAHDPFHNRNLAMSARDYRIETKPEFMRSKLHEAGLPRVAALPADSAGSGHYRVISPVVAASEHFHADGRILPGYPSPVQLRRLDVDVLFSQRQVDDGHLAALENLRRLAPQIRVVMDFDDLLTAVPKENAHHASVWPDIERRIGAACALSDRVTVSTEPLAAELARCHADIRVIRNGVVPADWPVPTPFERPGRLRVGWAGGISHAGDLAVLREVVAALGSRVDWVFFGMHPDDLPAGSFEFHPAVDFRHYPKALAGLRLDLALAPLAVNRFNECKSNLRLLEYGVLGIPVIATDIVPYRCGLPVTLVPNRADAWTRAILERIGEQAANRRDGEALRMAVLKDWTLERSLPRWLAAWTDR